MNKLILAAAAALLTACGTQATASTKATPAAPSSTASPAATPTQGTVTGPHFLDQGGFSKVAASQNGTDFSQLVSFDEVGLAAGASVNYRVTATATANYACNSTTVLDQVKQQVASGAVSAAAARSADSSGEVRYVMVVAPPTPKDTSCPSGYVFGAWKVQFANVLLSDMTNGVSQSIPGMSSMAQ
ncbi:MAG: hypothetical protein PVSMB9_07610 [Candidatus Dormibacteria bacterium]